MTERAALFRAVCADHEDDTPRLVFADWLDENGQPERAAFVRAQVEFARLMDDGSDSQAVYEFLRDRDWVTRPAAKWDVIDAGIARRVELAARIEALWNEYGPDWFVLLPADCGVKWGDFHRGFPGRAEVTDLDQLVASADRVKAAAPPVVLALDGPDRDAIDRLAKAGLLPWVRGLEVRQEYGVGLGALGSHPAVAGVRTLAVTQSNPTDGGPVAAALAGSPHWSGLRALDLKGIWCDPGAAGRLFGASHLRALTRFRAEGQDWNVETVRAFAAAGFDRLTDLRLTRSDLDDEAAEVLANAPGLHTVRYLDVGRNRITGRGATALLCSPHLAGVAFLGLEDNPVRRLDRAALKHAPAGGLRLFHCHGCRLSVGDVGAAIRSPRLCDLWYLDLDDNQLAPGVVRELVRGFKKRCPPVVWLTMNRIDDAAAAALAAWPAAAGLRVLQLYHNALTDAGVRGLLDSPHLKNLDGLGVSGATADVARLVKERFKQHGLVY